ncbi:MAG: GTPase domain-containing protein [Deferribacteraceae bacterium]|jgi:hypothetical protein|nr:GTPase domain-containing protein [Deferribacteraceae bacterium]
MAETVKCLYCFKEFDILNVHFRVKEDISLHDISLNKFIDIPRSVDKILKPESYEDMQPYLVPDRSGGFCYKLGKFDIDEDITGKDDYKNIFSVAVGKPILRRSAYTGNKKIPSASMAVSEYIEKVLFNSQTVRSEEQETGIALCPHCHQTLPANFGMYDRISISLIGTVRSGKTVYLAALANLMRKKGALILTDSKELKGMIDCLFGRDAGKESIKIPTTVQGQLPPFIFKYDYEYAVPGNSKTMTNTLLIVIYDMSGEFFRIDREQEYKYGLNIKNSDGIIFLLDPSELEHYKPKLNMIKKPQDYVIDTLNKKFFDNLKSDIPFILCMSKMDILTEFGDETREITELSKNITELENAETKCIDSRFFGNMNKYVRDLLNAVDEKAITKQIENFNRNTAMALSSLGAEPTSDNRISCKPVPKNVSEPLLWLLWQNGYLYPKKYSDTTDKGKYKTGMIKKILNFFKGK